MNATQQAEAAFEYAKIKFGDTIVGLADLKWEDIPEPVRRFLTENQKMTAIQIATLLLFACPFLALAPFYATVGLGGGGPIAATFASWYQSTYGATWIFRGLQSARMFGYATGAVNGVVQGAALVGFGVAQWVKQMAGGNGTQTGNAT